MPPTPDVPQSLHANISVTSFFYNTYLRGGGESGNPGLGTSFIITTLWPLVKSLNFLILILDFIY